MELYITDFHTHTIYIFRRYPNNCERESGLEILGEADESSLLFELVFHREQAVEHGLEDVWEGGAEGWGGDVGWGGRREVLKDVLS